MYIADKGRREPQHNEPRTSSACWHAPSRGSVTTKRYVTFFLKSRCALKSVRRVKLKKLRGKGLIEVDMQIIRWRSRRLRAAKALQATQEAEAQRIEAERLANDPKAIFKSNLFE